MTCFLSRRALVENLLGPGRVLHKSTQFAFPVLFSNSISLCITHSMSTTGSCGRQDNFSPAVTVSVRPCTVMLTLALSPGMPKLSTAPPASTFGGRERRRLQYEFRGCIACLSACSQRSEQRSTCTSMTSLSLSISLRPTPVPHLPSPTIRTPPPRDLSNLRTPYESLPTAPEKSHASD